MQYIKLIVILYQRDLNFRKATNLRILAEIKFLRIFLNLQYISVYVNYIFLHHLRKKKLELLLTLPKFVGFFDRYNQTNFR